MTESEFILSIFHQNRREATGAFRDFMERETEDTCLDERIIHKKSDGEVKDEIEALMDGEPIGKFLGMEKEKRNAILRILQANEGKTIRQIARVTRN